MAKLGEGDARDGAAGDILGVEDDEAALAAAMVVDVGHEPAFAFAGAAGDEEGLAGVVVGAGIPLADIAPRLVEVEDAAAVEGIRVFAQRGEPAVSGRPAGKASVVHGEVGAPVE